MDSRSYGVDIVDHSQPSEAEIAAYLKLINNLKKIVKYLGRNTPPLVLKTWMPGDD